jgi:hypothetical protein
LKQHKPEVKRRSNKCAFCKYNRRGRINERIEGKEIRCSMTARQTLIFETKITAWSYGLLEKLDAAKIFKKVPKIVCSRIQYRFKTVCHLSLF